MSDSWEVLDLTQPMDGTLAPYTEGSYSDPKFQMTDWCSIAERGYSCSKLTLGTQTGTHIDAPAHFVENGTRLDALPLPSLMGSYHFVDLDSAESTIAEADSAANILFITSQADVIEVSAEQFATLLAFDCPVWVIVCGVRVVGEDPLYMHQVVAQRGIFLVEDLEPTTARQVQPDGEMIVLPLHLIDAVGAPCRVVVRSKNAGKQS